MQALSLCSCGCNCSGTLWITASELLSEDGAVVACGGEGDSNDSSPHCGVYCHSSKLKVDSGQLSYVRATSSIVFSTVGGGSTLLPCTIFDVGGGMVVVYFK